MASVESFTADIVEVPAAPPADALSTRDLRLLSAGFASGEATSAPDLKDNGTGSFLSQRVRSRKPHILMTNVITTEKITTLTPSSKKMRRSIDSPIFLLEKSETDLYQPAEPLTLVRAVGRLVSH